MTEFVFGRHAAKKTEYVLGKMRSSLSDGKKVIIIVPEQQALFWDTVTAESLPPKYAFNVETVSFTRLADNVFRTFGGTARKYITDSQKTLLMWNTVVSCSDRMKSFRSLDREDRYAPSFLRFISELKLYSVSPADLLDAADRLGNAGTLPDRLRDLALIYSVYDEMLHRSFSDPAEIPDVLCETLRQHDYFSGCSVFIDSFYTLTPKELKIAAEILRGADDVTVTFAISEEDRGGPDCSFVWDYVKDMASICSRLSLDPKKTDAADGKVPELSYLCANLWDYSAQPYVSATDRITTVFCSDRYDEATLAAAYIKKLVAGGASYSDIAIAASDITPLRGITDTELQRCGIPVYVSGKTPLTSEPAFKLITAALSVIGSGWKKESLTAFLRTGLTGATPDMCDAFEKYTDIWNINGKRLYCGDDWGMNPDGYTEAVSEWGTELLALANGAKNVIVPSLEAFGESFGGNVLTICTAVHKLLCDFDVYGGLCREVAALSREGDISRAQEKSQVWDAICSLLDTVAGIIPDAACDPYRFASLICKVAETCNIGTIPDGIDRVVLGSASGMRLDGVKHLIVLGASSGEFPAVPREDGFFSDRDRALLEEAGIKLSPTGEKKLSEELFRFRYALSAPEETLCVMIPTEGGEPRPSVGASALIRLFPGRKHYNFTSAAAAEALHSFAGMGTVKSDVPLCADGDRIAKEAADSLFGKTLQMSQTRLEDFNDCPFKYYGKYVLHLDEGKTADIDPADVGVFVHAILENFVRESAEAGTFPVPDDIIISRSERLVSRYVASVCPDTLSSRRDWLFRRIHKSIDLYAHALSEEFAQSRFVPYRFELPVGFDPSLPVKPVELSDGGRMFLHGIVDRVDILRENGKVYLRVADYKTGTKKFHKYDVMNGRNVQLLLYLFSLCDCPGNCTFRKELAPGGEEVLPAGAVYFSAKPGSTSHSRMVDGEEAKRIAEENISREGIVLSDRSVIEAMDAEISGRYAPVTLNSDGSYSKRSSSVETLEGFREIENAMTRSLAGIGDRILRGEANSDPQVTKDRDPCEYCSMKAFCRHTGRKEDDADDDE